MLHLKSVVETRFNLIGCRLVLKYAYRGTDNGNVRGPETDFAVYVVR